MSCDPKRSFFREFAVRTTLRFTLLLALGMTVAAVGVFLGLRHSLLRETDEALEGDMYEFEQRLADPQWSEGFLKSELLREVGGRGTQQMLYRLFDPDDRPAWTVLPELADWWLPPSAAVHSAAAGRREHLVLPDDGHGDSITLLAPALLPDGQSRACQISISLAPMNRRLVKYALVLGAIWVAVVGAGAFISYRSALRPLRQIRAMTERAREISASSLHLRLPETGVADELDALARMLNEMLDRLQDSVRRLDQFTADAAHELRSPVARVRMAANVALSDRQDAQACRIACEDILRQADDLTALLNQLLFLAREGETGDALTMQELETAELLAEMASLYQAVAEDEGKCLCREAAAAATLRGDRKRLLQALGNLVENALRHTPRGGTITLAGQMEGAEYVFTVRDTGSGIAAEHLPHIFDRFYRADPARHDAGVGLGLSIVQAIARAHGGRVTAESKLGCGSTFRLIIPLAKPAGDAPPRLKMTTM